MIFLYIVAGVVALGLPALLGAMLLVLMVEYDEMDRRNNRRRR